MLWSSKGVPKDYESGILHRLLKDSSYHSSFVKLGLRTSRIHSQSTKTINTSHVLRVRRKVETNSWSEGSIKTE